MGVAGGMAMRRRGVAVVLGGFGRGYMMVVAMRRCGGCTSERRRRENDGEADGERFQPQRPILPCVPLSTCECHGTAFTKC